MSIVSSSGTLVKRESTFRVSIKNSESCSAIFPEKANESFTVYSVLVQDFKIGTRYFVNLLVEVLIAAKIGGKGGQLLMISL